MAIIVHVILVFNGVTFIFDLLIVLVLLVHLFFFLQLCCPLQILLGFHSCWSVSGRCTLT